MAPPCTVLMMVAEKVRPRPVRQARSGRAGVAGTALLQQAGPAPAPAPRRSRVCLTHRRLRTPPAALAGAVHRRVSVGPPGGWACPGCLVPADCLYLQPVSHKADT